MCTFKKGSNLSERLLVLLQAGLSRHRQEPKFLPLTDQLTELWGLGVEVLQGNGYNRLQLQSAPPLWMEKQRHGSQLMSALHVISSERQWLYFE